MGKKTIVVFLVSLALASVHLAEAQQSNKVPRIGFLSLSFPAALAARIEAFHIETAFGAASKGRADAVLVLPSPMTLSQRRQVVDLAAKDRLPAIYWATEFVEAGGLMTYSVSFTDLFRRAATYVDRILKGAKPADLPVEQPTKFEFIINLKTAKQIGLTIPANVLARADKVIK
jgi:putative tryptophan/tyrosine transport system substrate-binding protein